jgi:hypothetical protein
MSDANTEVHNPAELRSTAIQHALNLIKENENLSNILVQGIHHILSSAQQQATEIERKQAK